jgi:hypothetical protein
MEPGSAEQNRPMRRGVTALYYAIVGPFVAFAVGTVAVQVLSPSFRTHAPQDCRTGLRALALGVERARVAAVAATDDETAALSRFRSALAPEWDRHEAVAASCRRDPAWSSALDTVERLRYAEERAVRRDVSELSPLRRKVEELMMKDLDEQH